MSGAEFAIDARNLRKEFGPVVAVRDLSFVVPRGTIFGFLGPNGAGKSTSIKMLLGLVRPTGGTATVLGAPLGDVPIRRHIGFLPEDFRFYEWLTATELVRLHGRLSGMDAAALRRRVPEVIEMVGLAPHRDRPLRGFSKGMLQRIGLAQAIVHEPAVVFLDEPTSGLDPMGRRMVRDILRAERDRGATVFLNSHLLSEIEVTCDQVAFIKDGAIVATRSLGVDWGEDLRVVVDARGVSEAALAGLARWTASAQVDGERLTFGVASEEVLPEVVRHLVDAGADVFRVSPERVSLEDVFVQLVGEDRGL
ncbi:MAG TPA: ABC transporter ATP-binding protein [Gemmatimonadaceae bacterium]